MIPICFLWAFCSCLLHYLQENFGQHQQKKTIHFFYLSSSSPQKWNPSIFFVLGPSNIPALICSSLRFGAEIQKWSKPCPFPPSFIKICFFSPSLMTSAGITSLYFSFCRDGVCQWYRCIQVSIVHQNTSETSFWKVND